MIAATSHIQYRTKIMSGSPAAAAHGSVYTVLWLQVVWRSVGGNEQTLLVTYTWCTVNFVLCPSSSEEQWAAAVQHPGTRHGENMQIPQGKAPPTWGLNPGTSCIEATELIMIPVHHQHAVKCLFSCFLYKWCHISHERLALRYTLSNTLRPHQTNLSKSKLLPPLKTSFFGLFFAMMIIQKLVSWFFISKQEVLMLMCEVLP